jgi:hypothetical protein
MHGELGARGSRTKLVIIRRRRWTMRIVPARRSALGRRRVAVTALISMELELEPVSLP